MRRFKQYNKSMKIAKQIKRIARKYYAKNFRIFSIFMFKKYVFINFTLPNNYKICIWNNNNLYAEHLLYYGKFIPNKTRFEDKFESLEDVRVFIKLISELKEDKYDKKLYELKYLDKRGEIKMKNCINNYKGYCKEFDDFLDNNFCEVCNEKCKFYKSNEFDVDDKEYNEKIYDR